MDETIEFIRLYCRSFASMVAGAPRLHTRFGENSALILSGEDTLRLNTLTIGPEENPIRFLTESVGLARERGLPLKAAFTPHVAEDLAPQAKWLGLTPAGKTALLSLRPTTALAGTVGCAVQRAAGPRAIQEMARLVSGAFDGFPAASLLRVSNSGSRTEIGREIFLGSRDGLAISTVSVSRSGDAAGIFAMATAREFQRMGIGRALLTQVINIYRDLGVTRFYLNATKVSQSFYESIGFQMMGHLAVWQLGSPQTDHASN